MGAKNKVIAGEYQGKAVEYSFGQAFVTTGLFKSMNLDKSTVEAYELMDESHRKSVASGIGRGLVGGFLLGTAGLAEGLAAKSKGVHIVAVQFTDGKKSLLEVDEKIYKAIMTKCF